MAEETSAKIRKFRTKDIYQILEIERQAFPKTPYSKGTLLHYANNLPDSFVVIESGDNVLGYMIFDLDGHIHSTAVRMTYRRKGFGKMLFMHASKCARKRLWLEVRSKNNGAIGFYRRMGMEVAGRISNYYGNDDALIMVLDQSK